MHQNRPGCASHKCLFEMMIRRNREEDIPVLHKLTQEHGPGINAQKHVILPAS
jgi:hypothetical protein